ncbi:MAG: DUF1592 domain-containing protein, partial [Verrucomicrobiota bacterium]|nr:DUF1592 domain-containing protein [Verrucomicrobiota bacterium]
MPIRKQDAYGESISWISRCIRVGFLVFISQFFLINLIAQGDSDKAIDSNDLKERATRILNTYCVSCHGPEKQKGEVQLNDLESIDAVDLQSLFSNIKEVVHFREMPPEDAKQLTTAERSVLLGWLENQLTGKAAKALEEKLKRFEYGNVTPHEDLFSGEHYHLKGYTLDRRWLISEFIFNEKINHLLNYYPSRTIYGRKVTVEGDSGIHWSPKTERGNKFRRTITNPFLLPEKVGVRYSSHKRLTTGHLLTMIGNAKRVAKHITSEGTMKSYYPAMFSLMKNELDQREKLRSREQFMRTYTFIDRLLNDVYGKNHYDLLPTLIRKEIPYPGPPKHSSNGIQKRHENLEFLDRFNKEDIDAIMRGIATYKESGFNVDEISDKSELDRKGNPVWAPYSNANRKEFDQIINYCESDWFKEGVTDYRIQNRITTMKLFFDTWDMNRVYNHIKNGNFGPPEYSPPNDEEAAIITEAIKKHRSKGDTYSQIIDKCLADWKESFKAEDGNNESSVRKLIDELYVKIFERMPTELERTENLEQLNLYTQRVGLQKAIGKLIEALILSTEFAYRNEFGEGDADKHGRRMMSPRNASYALAYALTDAAPDKELISAVKDSRLKSRKDYEREIRRILKDRQQWYVIDENVQAMNLNASVTNQPIRKLRFFREFFGYPKAQDVFKDDSRFGAGRHEQAVSRLVDEADMLVEYVLEKDERVFEELLTTKKFYVYHSGDNSEMKAGSDQLKKVYNYFNKLEWKTWEPNDIAPHKDFMMTVWEFNKARSKDNKSLLGILKRMMTALEIHFHNGQVNGMPYMKMAMGFWHGGNV